MSKPTSEPLGDSDALLRTAVEGAPVAMVMVNERGAIVLVNAQAEKLFGYDRRELLGQSVEMLVPQRFREGHPALRGSYHRAPIMRAMGAGRELYGLRKDGSEVPIEIGLNPVKDDDRQFVVASIIDISERKRAEQARQESEQRYSELVEQAHEGIIVRSPTGEFVFVNNAFCHMLGYGRPELLGMNIREVVFADDLDTVAQIEALQARERLQLEKRLRHRDGHTLNVEVSVRRLDSGDFQSTFHDVTERKRAELKLRSYAEELRQMSKRVLHAQEEERRRIARELHDEVGQALTAAQIRLRDLEQLAAGGPVAKSATEISEIIAGLLQTVRTMSLDLRPSVLDDLGLASAMRWFVRERVASAGLQVEVDIQKDLPRFAATLETSVFRVTQSALTNVVRHARARSVTVSLTAKDGKLVLTIRDDGQGFDLDAARKRAQEGGSVGLLGMEEWVRLSGGGFSIESNPGAGTQVLVVLPVPESEDGDSPQGG